MKDLEKDFEVTDEMRHEVRRYLKARLADPACLLCIEELARELRCGEAFLKLWLKEKYPHTQTKSEVQMVTAAILLSPDLGKESSKPWRKTLETFRALEKIIPRSGRKSR